MAEYTLHLGDCLEYMRTLPDGCFDAVVTDPPYGIGYVAGNGGDNHARHAYRKHKNRPIYGDDKAFDPSPFLRFDRVIMFGGNHFSNHLPPSRGWVVWDKNAGVKPNTFSDAELIYTNCDVPLRIFPHMWKGIQRDSEVGEGSFHPTQKPAALMVWLLRHYTRPGDTIFDPFMGSGTTGVACMQLGRNFVGCEIDPGYYAIAEKRIREAAAQPPLFTDTPPVPKPEQAGLFAEKENP